MGFVKIRGPAGMVDGDVDKNPGIAQMNGIHQFDKLFQGSGVMIKFSQGGVNRGKAQCGIRTAESSHAAIGGGGGMNRQQHQNPAPELAQNKIQFADQIPERSRGRNHRITDFVKICDELLIRTDRMIATCFVGTELAHKGVINDVGAAGIRRINVEDGIGARGPDRSRSGLRDKERFGFEVTAFIQRQCGREGSPVNTFHRNIKPGSTQRGFILFNLPDNFPADDFGLSDIGAHPGRTILRLGQDKGEHRRITAKFHHAFSRGRVLNQLFIDVHNGGDKRQNYC